MMNTRLIGIHDVDFKVFHLSDDCDRLAMLALVAPGHPVVCSEAMGITSRPPRPIHSRTDRHRHMTWHGRTGAFLPGASEEGMTRFPLAFGPQSLQRRYDIVYDMFIYGIPFSYEQTPQFDRPRGTSFLRRVNQSEGPGAWTLGSNEQLLT